MVTTHNDSNIKMIACNESKKNGDTNGKYIYI